MEGMEIPNPKKHNDETVKYRAAMVWTSKFIPRNDIDKTVPESNHVNNWLKKRNLNYEKFQLLVNGNLPPVSSEVATTYKSNMRKGGTESVQQQEEATPEKKQKKGAAEAGDCGPVFRHGSEATRICDLALAVTGPKDPKLAKIILNDDNAQMAFHLHKTLGAALDRYKKITEPEHKSEPKPMPPVWASETSPSVQRIIGRNTPRAGVTPSMNSFLGSSDNGGTQQQPPVNSGGYYPSASPVTPWEQGMAPSAGTPKISYATSNNSGAVKHPPIPSPVPTRAGAYGSSKRGQKRKHQDSNNHGNAKKGNQPPTGYARPRGNVGPANKRGTARGGRGGRPAKRGKFTKK